ncbi:Hypothetical protein A7982_06145 [Minicystis rosea]|nr:Hypothetical protein A7982_06145 [Minicystis rosea]
MLNRTSRSAVDVLLELLDKVPDAATLEVLLEPEHLRTLLHAQGVSDDTIRRELLAGGRLPGELLLDVLAREPDTAVLLRMLGNPALPVAKKVTPRHARGDTPTSPSAPRTGVRAVPALILGLLLAIPSGWFLFVRLDVLRVPGLIAHFPGAYTLLFSALVGGVLLFGTGLRGLLQQR